MPTAIKKGSKVLVVEGPSKGREGTVTKLAREYDREMQVTRWTVWLDTGKWKIKTRLSWVREVSP
jgi:ribosomal protein L24